VVSKIWSWSLQASGAEAGYSLNDYNFYKSRQFIAGGFWFSQQLLEERHKTA
jgi:hypothetical protein